MKQQQQQNLEFHILPRTSPSCSQEANESTLTKSKWGKVLVIDKPKTQE